MPYIKVWEGLGQPSSGGEGNLDRELVLAAARGDYDEVDRLVGALVVVGTHPGTVPGGLNTTNGEVARDPGALRMTGIVQVAHSGSIKGFETAETALQAAAAGGHWKIVDLLRDNGVDVNAPIAQGSGWRALQAVAWDGNENFVQQLVDRNADVNAPAAIWGGRTALQAASERGHRGVVKLLINCNAAVNAPAAYIYGRTALQAAAQGGHEEVVKLLLGERANVNADASNANGRTALQAAAENGHERIVELLLDHGAAVNGLPGYKDGRSALQAAAQGGHAKLVELLIEKGAGVNEPGSEINGRTALQAAAQEGHVTLVKLLLLTHSADINHQASSEGGRTALQAAAEGGYETIVQLLLDHSADVNAPASLKNGKSAFQAAAHGGHVGVMKLILDKDANVRGLEDNQGQNFLHLACGLEDDVLLGDLLKLSSPKITNAKDSSGSTPLHVATRNGRPKAVELLVMKGANKELQDTSGRTPLGVAVEKKFRDIVDYLLKNGASTDTVSTSKYQNYLRTLEGGEDYNCITVSHKPGQGRIIRTTKWQDEKLRLDQGLFESVSILFQRPKQSEGFTPYRSDPMNTLASLQLLADSGYKGPELTSSSSMIKWVWAPCKQSHGSEPGHEVAGGLQSFAEFPDNEQILSLSPSLAVMIGHIRFVWPAQDSNHSGNIPPHMLPVIIPPFNSGAQKVEICLVMSNKDTTRVDESDQSMRFIHYRGTFSLKTLSIPKHGVEFLIWLLDDVNERWAGLITNAKAHLSQRRASQLIAAGRERMIILSLLQDSQEWYRLRGIWREHRDKAKRLMVQFTENDILKNGAQTRLPEGATARVDHIGLLRRQMTMLGENCGQALSELDLETKELIELEFNLVSIHEARQSLEMARSMKRLSWITFIFLPLMFVTGLFGMNVDILGRNPEWKWYFVIAGPFLVFVIIVSVLCKYLPVKESFKGIDMRLEKLFSSSITPGATSMQQSQGGGEELGSFTDTCPRSLLDKILRRRGFKQPEDEEGRPP